MATGFNDRSAEPGRYEPNDGAPEEGWDGVSSDVLVPAAPPHHSAVSAFKAGFSDMWRLKAMAWRLYVVNLIWAVLWSLPLMAALSRVLGSRPAGEVLADRWDVEVLAELLLDHPDIASLSMALAVFSVIGYALFNVFLTAGVVHVAAARIRPSLAEFGRRAISGFLRVFSMSVIFLVLVAASLFFLFALLGIGKYATEDMGTGATVCVRALVALPALALLALVDAAMDYARIHVVTHRGKTSFLTSFKFGWKIIFRRGASAVWLHLGYGLVSWAVVALLMLLPTNLDAGGSANLLAGFAIWQVFILLRVAIRVAGLSGQKLFAASAPEYVA